MTGESSRTGTHSAARVPTDGSAARVRGGGGVLLTVLVALATSAWAVSAQDPVDEMDTMGLFNQDPPPPIMIWGSYGLGSAFVTDGAAETTAMRVVNGRVRERATAAPPSVSVAVAAGAGDAFAGAVLAALADGTTDLGELAAVGNADARSQIRSFALSLGYREGDDFFCVA